MLFAKGLITAELYPKTVENTRIMFIMYHFRKEKAPRSSRGAQGFIYLNKLCDLVVAAATEHDNYCKNDDPGAIIVEDVA